MPITTDLESSPYFDDYDSTKDFYKILFRPGYSVQTRELNQLQTILQKQVERFGDNIFKRGTIVDGCNFQFFPNFPYIKIEDSEVGGTTSTPSRYKKLFIKNETNGLKAFVNDYRDGFESSDPDLKTLYIRYLNSGTTGTINTFSSGDVLTVYDSLDSIYSITIDNGGSRFSNSDTLIVTPTIIANVTTGSFSNGEYITNGTANLQIIGIDSTTLSNSSQIILTLKPRDTDLANATVNSTAWTISNNDSIVNISNTVTATVEGLIGSGLSGSIKTNAIGKIVQISITDQGSNYTKIPNIRVKSANNTTGLSSLVLTAKNYLSKIIVSDVANSVGDGYAFGVSEGVIYQKGFFLRVDPQTIIIEKYSTSPNAISVGFSTKEKVITPEIDITLLDNAFIEENENAPGSHRLKLTPELIVLDKVYVDGNTEFLSICEWSEGNAFRQKQTSEYNKINDEMARRTADESGNYAIDPFLISTRSPLDSSLEGNTVSVVVDPGHAYISGYRINTVRNYVVDINKGIDTKLNTSSLINLNYGNFIHVSELGGIFQFNTGDTIDFYDTAKEFHANVENALAGNTNPVGVKIGTGRARSLTSLEDGINYRLYVFDIQMEQGKNFKDVKSVYYNGTNKGICDVNLTLDATTNTNIAVLKRTDESSLLFYSGVDSLKNANNINYHYRTIDQSTTTVNTGILIKDISASVNEFFPYTGDLSTLQLSRLIVIPHGNNLIASANLAGNASVNTTSNAAIGSGTTYLTDLRAGDYVQVYSNSTTAELKKVILVTNNTHLQLSSNLSFANTTSKIYRAFPKNIPVPFGTRSGFSGNVDANSNILTLDFGMRFDYSGSVNTSLIYNVKRVNPDQSTKTPNRNRFIKICCGNNAGGVNGPWVIGVPDVFRLRNVYVGNSSVNSSSNNYVTNFYIDHNQNSDFYDLSWLYLLPKTSISLNGNSYILVEFDYFTTSGSGFYDTVSYVSSNAEQRFETDSLPLANLSSQINSFEIPELFTYNGKNVDPIQHFDFRPYVSNTVAPTTNAALAPLNPSNTISFGNTADPSNDKKFPLPDSTFTATIEHFIGRIDSVFVTKDGKITVLKGIPHPDPKQKFPPTIPNDVFKIADLNVEAYPNVPILRSTDVGEILNTRVLNEQFLKRRLDKRTISKILNRGIVFEQTKGYSMADIAKIDKRLKDVEYYVSLNALESDLKDRVIPSSIDPTLDRFKFGFFVDDAHNYLQADRDNPQYSAYIEDDCYVPEKLSWLIMFEPFIGTDVYIDHEIIFQSLATTPLNWNPPCLPGTLVANTFAYRIQNSDREYGNTISSYIDTYNITFAAAQTSPASLFFYNYDNDVKYEIYQGSTLIANSSSAANLTSSEIAFVTSNTAGQWFNDNANTYLTNFVDSGGGYVKYSGKISWSHNPTSGRQYTIKVYKGSGANRWRYLVEYPIDRDTVGCPTIINPLDPYTPINWDGGWGWDLGSGGAEGGASGCGSGD